MVFPGGSPVKNLPSVQESQKRQGTSLGHKDPWEEGMVTLSSILSWRIPWREEPCPPPGDLYDPGMDPASPATPALQADSLLLSSREDHTDFIGCYTHIKISG